MTFGAAQRSHCPHSHTRHSATFSKSQHLSASVPPNAKCVPCPRSGNRSEERMRTCSGKCFVKYEVPQKRGAATLIINNSKILTAKFSQLHTHRCESKTAQEQRNGLRILEGGALLPSTTPTKNTQPSLLLLQKSSGTGTHTASGFGFGADTSPVQELQTSESIPDERKRRKGQKKRVCVSPHPTKAK